MRKTSKAGAGVVVRGILLGGCWVLLGTLLWGWGGSAQASSKAEAVIRQAVGLYEKLQFGPALRKFQEVLRREDLTVEQQARIYVYEGFCLFYTRGATATRLKLRQAFRLRLHVKIPPQTPPPLRKLFVAEQKKARARAATRRPKVPWKVQIWVVGSVESGQPIRVAGRSSRRPDKARAVLLLRRSGTESYRDFPLRWKGKRDKGFEGQALNPYPRWYKGKGSLDFLVEIRSSQGKVLARSHPRHKPGQATLGQPPQKKPGGKPFPWYWPVAIGAGVAVAAGVVVAVVLLTPPRPSVEVYIDIRKKN